MTEFGEGAKHARDDILSMIIGLQNGIMHKMDSEEYKAYQTVYDRIVEIHGDMFKDYK